MNQNNFEFRKEFIYNAIDDTTNTIRFLDTKAAAVFVAIGLVLTFLAAIKDCIYNSFKFYEGMSFLHNGFIILIVAYSILIITSVIYSFIGVNAINNPKEHIVSDGMVTSLWYLTYKKGLNPKTKKKTDVIATSLNQYVNEIRSLTEDSLIEQISLELLKVSYIRDKKLKAINNSVKYFIISFIPLALVLTVVFYHYFIYKIDV